MAKAAAVATAHQIFIRTYVAAENLL